MSNIIATDFKDDSNDITTMQQDNNNDDDDINIEEQTAAAITPNSINGENLVENESENVDIIREIEVLQQQYDEQKQQQQQQQQEHLVTISPQQTQLLSETPKRREKTTTEGLTNFMATVDAENIRTNPVLDQHKNELKRSILRKRSILERNIRMKISDEVNTPATGNETISTATNPILQDMLVDEHENKLSESKFCSAENITASKPKPKPQTQITSNLSKPRANLLTKKSKKPAINLRKTNTREERAGPSSLNLGGVMARARSRNLAKQKEKLYCICQTPYDDTKFYVGCDVCTNWFHGDCVNISEEASKQLTEYICADCKLTREPQELYCLCRQPYDESQFYICCDKCQGWFHGRCVGIVQTEAVFIDEYVCPDCQTNNATNKANMKTLTDEEKNDLRKLIKVVRVSKKI